MIGKPMEKVLDFPRTYKSFERRPLFAFWPSSCGPSPLCGLDRAAVISDASRYRGLYFRRPPFRRTIPHPATRFHMD